MRFFARALFAVVLVAASVAVVPSRAGAQEVHAPKLTLVDQPAWVTAGDLLQLGLRLEPPGTSGLQVRAELHSAIHTRLGFEQTIGGQGLGGIVDRAFVDVDTAPKGPHDTLFARFGMPGAGLPPNQTLRVHTTGVYPLDVELRSGSATIDHFVTWVVYVADGKHNTPAIPEPLSLSWVWSVQAPPAFGPGGAPPDAATLAQFGSNGRLGKIAALLEQARGVPITLALSPETLQSWLTLAHEHPELRAGVAALRAAAGDRANQLLPTPYVPINLPQFEQAGLGQYLVSQIQQGAATLQHLTGAGIDTRTAFVDPVDTPSLSRLQSLLFQQVLVAEGSLVPQQSNLTPAQPFTLQNGSDNVAAASTNPTVESWLNGDATPAVRAQRFIAGLSLIALEAPGTARGIVVATPSVWTPVPALVTRILSGLHDNPLLETATLDDYFANVAPAVDDQGQPVVRALTQPSQPPLYPVMIDTSTYQHAVQSLSSFRSLVGANDPRVQRGERALRTALTTDFGPTRAAAELGVIDSAATQFLDKITLVQQRVTLTARHVKIPLTFRNATKQSVRVRVLLSAPSGKVLFPDGSQSVITLAPGNQTLRFTVETRATGTFAMTVTLTSEDGQLPVGPPTQITVRSTVFSGWGAALTIGALAFLALWWGNNIWKSRRRGKQAVTTAMGGQ